MLILGLKGLLLQVMNAPREEGLIRWRGGGLNRGLTILVTLSWDTPCGARIQANSCTPSLPMLNFMIL